MLKEVTETTTLRVSQSTHFGVTSYKLTSNTVKDDHEHTDIHEMQDLREMIKRESTDNQNATGLHSPKPQAILKEIESHVIPTTIDHEILQILPRSE